MFSLSSCEVFSCNPTTAQTSTVEPYIFSHRNIAVPIATLKGVRVRAPLGELEAAGTVAVQAIACTDKVEQDVDVAGWPVRVVNRLAVSTSEHMFVLRRSKISFLSVFEQLRTDLAIIRDVCEWDARTRNTYVCSHWCEGLPARLTEDLRQIHGSFRSSNTLNNGTSERSSLRSRNDSWIGWRGREHLRGCSSNRAKTVERTEKSEGSRRKGRGESAFFL
jgi:hypothetical protein